MSSTPSLGPGFSQQPDTPEFQPSYHRVTQSQAADTSLGNTAEVGMQGQHADTERHMAQDHPVSQIGTLTGLDSYASADQGLAQQYQGQALPVSATQFYGAAADEAELPSYGGDSQQRPPGELAAGKHALHG